MRLVSFSAETPAAALAQIHKELGPEAVVLAVRPMAASGLARLWPKRRGVEVLAGVADEQDELAPDEMPQEGRGLQSDLVPEVGRAGPSAPSSTRDSGTLSSPASFSGGLRTARPTLRIDPTRGPLAPPLYDGTGRPHVFLGPPGVGKTTLLCKWLVTAVLSEGRAARLWRLDGTAANTAELLNVYGEMFGLTVERFWQTPCAGAPVSPPRSPLDFEAEEAPVEARQVLLIDLPGVEVGDAQALCMAKEQLAALPSPRLHLVLNAAYEVTTLLEQYRAFAPFQPEDLSFTHLDEEKRHDKLLGFATGTNCPVRFLSGGQKIPGQFTQVSGPHTP
jgi:flagellar biosynthesis GTPase FlhF